MREYEQIEALNWSSLKEMAASPLHYQWRVEHPRRDTPAFALGRAVHCAILEPDAFDERYFVPEALQCVASTKAGLLQRQAGTVLVCVESVARHAEASAALEGTHREVACTWTDPETGTACKGRLDAVARGRMVDMKTTGRGLATFPRDAANYLYHGQLAWYIDGAIAAGLCDRDAAVQIVAVETCEPYDAALFTLPPYVVEAGRRLCRRLLSEWVECRAAGIWPGRYPSATALHLPDWAPGMRDDEGGDL